MSPYRLYFDYIGYSRVNTSARLILSSIILDNIDKLLSLIVELRRDKINGINLSDADKSIYSRLDYIAEEKQSWMEAIIDPDLAMESCPSRQSAPDARARPRRRDR